MKKEVIAVFDIGKTNKKIVLFDSSFNLVYENEIRFNELTDDDGYPCDDIEGMIKWIKNTTEELTRNKDYDVKALNFSTYGATLVFIDEKGNRTAPVYNYLKPMPDGLLDDFYKRYGGVDEFSRITASPAMGMLNSGLQAYYLKKAKFEFFTKTKYILHLPQYLSYLFTNKIVSELTSIGCHTALWNFDKMTYHKWLGDEKIHLPQPIKNTTTYDININGKTIKAGIGIHDSSASLVPYLRKYNKQQFLLISSGTWAINMNPFSKDALTIDELKQDCLCYLSVDANQVKASRLFLGHIHELNANKLSGFFKVSDNEYKKVNTDRNLADMIFNKNQFLFFPNGIPSDYIGNIDMISQFKNFSEAYHQLMFELTKIECDKIKLALDKDDKTADFIISGGFNKNELFKYYLTKNFPDKNIIAADIDNSTALGAAMVVMPEWIKP
jgi:sugar (pentulose or hexulose) kinase